MSRPRSRLGPVSAVILQKISSGTGCCSAALSGAKGDLSRTTTCDTSHCTVCPRSACQGPSARPQCDIHSHLRSRLRSTVRGMLVEYIRSSGMYRAMLGDSTLFQSTDPGMTVRMPIDFTFSLHSDRRGRWYVHKGHRPQRMPTRSRLVRLVEMLMSIRKTSVARRQHQRHALGFIALDLHSRPQVQTRQLPRLEPATLRHLRRDVENLADHLACNCRSYHTSSRHRWRRRPRTAAFDLGTRRIVMLTSLTRRHHTLPPIAARPHRPRDLRRKRLAWQLLSSLDRPLTQVLHVLRHRSLRGHQRTAAPRR